jgi:hypothetical protein
MKPYIYILYFIACIVIGASADGLMDDGFKLWGHILGALEILLLLGGVILKPRSWAAFIVAYVCWRVVGFDITYNLVRGFPITYVGTTGLWDMFFSKYEPSGLIWMRGIFLILAIHIPFRYLKPVNNSFDKNTYSI